MADETLQQIRQSIDQLNTTIDRAKSLISALSEAGEDVTKLRQDLNSLEIRKNKWETMLKNRGY
jgi:flagellar biosynthesis chaperone FliJ